MNGRLLEAAKVVLAAWDAGELEFKADKGFGKTPYADLRDAIADAEKDRETVEQLQAGMLRYHPRPVAPQFPTVWDYYATALCQRHDLSPSEIAKKANRFLELRPPSRAFDDNRSITTLGLSVRAENCLRWGSPPIETVGELCGRTEADIIRIRNLGRRTLQEIKDKLATLGLRLKENR